MQMNYLNVFHIFNLLQLEKLSACEFHEISSYLLKQQNRK